MLIWFALKMLVRASELKRKSSGLQSATDIASFTTGRASVLISPRGAFGAQKQHLLLRDASRIRAELDRLLLQDSNRMMLRPYIAR
jgi:hypothetical protein